MKILYAVLLISCLLFLDSCVGFTTDTSRYNNVDGCFFQDTGAFIHFSDTCFFSQYYPDFLSAKHKECAELSCRVEERAPFGDYCIYIAIPHDAYSIKDNQIILPSHCTVNVKFLLLSGDVVFVHSEYSALARFRQSDLPYKTKADESVAPCHISVKLSLENGGVLLLAFDRAMNGSIFRLYSPPKP